MFRLEITINITNGKQNIGTCSSYVNYTKFLQVYQLIDFPHPLFYKCKTDLIHGLEFIHLFFAVHNSL
ncbi:hypothetical protein VNO77_36573 [Canavalia gladiata]|uniref:Uncharacterized protein n=1 Tax=Canavalia gladiata TaxID=3824 RepID=A0AAN9K809_CANGL